MDLLPPDPDDHKDYWPRVYAHIGADQSTVVLVCNIACANITSQRLKDWVEALLNLVLGSKKEENQRLQMMEGTDHTTVVLMCNLTDTGIDGERLKDLVQALIMLLPSEKRQEKEGSYNLFLQRFGLKDRPATRDGWRRLTETTTSGAEMSVRLTNIFEGEGFKTLSEPCFLTRDQLNNLRNFGETTLKELQAKVKDVSGLSLIWK